MKLCFSPDLSGIHLQGPLCIFCVSEGGVRGFFDYSVSWRECSAIPYILMQKRERKDSTVVLCRGSTYIYDRKHAHSLVIMMLKKLFPVTKYTQFMPYAGLFYSECNCLIEETLKQVLCELVNMNLNLSIW